MADEASIAVAFEGVSRVFGTVRAVDRLSFAIRDGEFFSMLGPSGSGKTTCLRLIAGFEEATEGRIRLHGRDVVGVPPYERDVNTVFQDYALFPHMTVWENVAYGLMIRRVPKPERRRRADEMLAMVKLDGMAARKPGQLSGGQRQRVALARALINRPSVLLLDEPLGALDLKLREAMQEELKALQRQVGITFVYVTHDQGEALAMSDRVAVFNRGRIEQIGSPVEIYDKPATAFVAGFVGVSNTFDAAAAERAFGLRSAFTIRPERIRLMPPSAMLPPGMDGATGTVEGRSFLGANIRLRVRVADDATIDVVLPSIDLDTVLTQPGAAVLVAWEQRFRNTIGAAA